jgi:opacity protein-like surface antigen
MRVLVVAAIISLSAVSAIAQSAPEPKKPENERERLGLRAGFVGTPSDLSNTFGNGFNLALHWIQHIKHPLFLDVTLGAFYMGRTDRDDITQNFFNQSFDGTSLRIIRFTIAPLFEFNVNEKTAAYLSVGGGVYIVSLLLDEAFYEFDSTDNHMGVNVGTGVTYRITTNWFLDFHAEMHKFWTSTASDDIFLVYSEGDQDPLFFQVTAGLLLRLF